MVIQAIISYSVLALSIFSLYMTYRTHKSLKGLSGKRNYYDPDYDMYGRRIKK